MLLSSQSSLLIVIDLQEKLVPAIAGGDELVRQAGSLIEAARHLEVPVIFTEQNPEGLGPTLAPLKAAGGDAAKVIAKSSFAASAEAAFQSALGAAMEDGHKQVILCGAEAHICVLQSALGIKTLVQGLNLDVFVVADAIGSRRALSFETALTRLQANDVEIVTTEMVLFEWLGSSEHAAFKTLRQLIL